MFFINQLKALASLTQLFKEKPGEEITQITPLWVRFLMKLKINANVCFSFFSYLAFCGELFIGI